MAGIPPENHELFRQLVNAFPQESDTVIAELVSRHGSSPAECVSYLENRMQKMRSLANPVFAPPDERYYPWNRRGSGRGSYVIRRRGANDGQGPGTAARPSLHLEMPGHSSFSDDERSMDSPAAQSQRDFNDLRSLRGERRAESSPGPPGNQRAALTLKFPSSQASSTRSGSPLSIQVVQSPTSSSFGIGRGMPRRMSIGSPLANPPTRTVPTARLHPSATTGQLSNRVMDPLSINTADYPLEEFPRQASTVFDTPSPSTPGSDRPNPARNIRISYSPSLPSVSPSLSSTDRLRHQRDRKDMLEERYRSAVSRVEELRSDVSQMELPPTLLSSISGNITQGDLQVVHEETRRLQAEVNAMIKRLKAAQPAKKKSTEEGGWNCSVCTFLNHPFLQRCEMCELPRVRVIAGTKPPPSPLGTRKSSFRCYCCQSGIHVARPEDANAVSEDGWEIVPRLSVLSPSIFR